MKKVLTSVAVLTMMMSGALAADGIAQLTSKTYVDAGLKALYDISKTDDSALDTKIDGVAADVDDLAGVVDGHTASITTLETTVGHAAGNGEAATGLVRDLANLKAQVDALEDSDTTYESGVGITVDEHNHVGLKGFAADPDDGKMYVFKDGTWVALNVVDENAWDDSIFTSGN